jgi:hypothetical protein
MRGDRGIIWRWRRRFLRGVGMRRGLEGVVVEKVMGREW